MNLAPIKVYIDTSVFGGCFDDEFEKYSLKFFDKIRNGEIIGLVSDIVLEELLPAPEKVQNILSTIPDDNIILLKVNEKEKELANKYINENLLTPKWYEDALHIAIATYERANVIVSWNFKHIVRTDKIIQFNRVNILNTELIGLRLTNTQLRFPFLLKKGKVVAR
ncbi:MAG: PIN domain-containing protein [Verrucomicrobiota bacterium]|nr:PIN domain-containing protein [Verrucomicrobiota bacterium]